MVAAATARVFPGGKSTLVVKMTFRFEVVVRVIMLSWKSLFQSLPSLHESQSALAGPFTGATVEAEEDLLGLLTGEGPSV